MLTLLVCAVVIVVAVVIVSTVAHVRDERWCKAERAKQREIFERTMVI